MKYTKVLGLALAALTFNACSDEWDEHYVAKPLGNGASLWETISTEEKDLNNFKMVLDSCGYGKVLASSQVFTVFAPTDDYFTKDQAEELIKLYQYDRDSAQVKEKDNRAIKEFVMNHIALYNHSVSIQFSDTIIMMNGKYQTLTNNAIGGQEFLEKNLPHSNGILYTVDGQLGYLSNVFEKMEKVAGLDSVAAFFKSYNEYEFMPELSVPGEIKNGQTVYLDSVTRLKNDLFEYVGKISDEDSTYWMVAPDNEMWNRMVEEYTNYFVYDDSVANGDSLQYLYSRLAIVRGTVFSATENPGGMFGDSVKSTEAMNYKSRFLMYGNYDTYYYQYDNPANGVFADVENFECSNGILMKANKWNIDKSQTFSQMILTEAEDLAALAYVDDDVDGTAESKDIKTRVSTVKVPTNSDFYNKVSGNSFVEIVPTGGSNPKATFFVRNVLSMPYDIYAVMVPAIAANPKASDKDRAPIKAIVTLGYHNEKGIQEQEEIAYDLTARTDGLDTVLLKSNVMIPTCSYGLQDVNPQVTIQIESDVTSRENSKGTYTRTMRLDAIIFKPHAGEGEEIVIE